MVPTISKQDIRVEIIAKELRLKVVSLGTKAILDVD